MYVVYVKSAGVCHACVLRGSTGANDGEAIYSSTYLPFESGAIEYNLLIQGNFHSIIRFIMTDQNEEAEKVALNKKSSPFKAIKRHRLGQLSAVEKLLLLSASICALVLVTLVFIITSPMVKNSLSSVDVSNLSATVEKETYVWFDT